ncbi:MAG: carboxypeptidase-like regulatory domain-containing protein, partial [Thermoguttaceae bacterium]
LDQQRAAIENRIYDQVDDARRSLVVFEPWLSTPPTGYLEVTGITPSVPVGGTIDRIDVTFNKPLRLGTFSGDDITITDPNGQSVAVLGIERKTPTVYGVTFAQQTGAPDLHGDYAVRIGPAIEDAGGTPMDGNGNQLPGDGQTDMDLIVSADAIPQYTYHASYDYDYGDTRHQLEAMLEVPSLGVGNDYYVKAFSKSVGSSAPYELVATLIDIDGSLIVNGTAEHPVVMTSVADDTFAGDSNNDGDATAPQRGSWPGLTFRQHSFGDLSGIHILHASRAIDANYQWADVSLHGGVLAELGWETASVHDLFDDLMDRIKTLGDATVSGRLLDANTGQPLVDTELVLFSESDDAISRLARTDDNGVFTFTAVTNDTFHIRVGDDYRASQATEITVLADRDVTNLQITAARKQVTNVQEEEREVLYDSVETLMVDGVAHVIFAQGEQLYHSYHNGTAWVAPTAIPEAVGASPELAYSENLFGADAPGLVLLWSETSETGTAKAGAGAKTVGAPQGGTAMGLFAATVASITIPDCLCEDEEDPEPEPPEPENPEPGDDDRLPGYTSHTPEDKYGPTGYDAPGTPENELKRFVSSDDPMLYRIDFWNEVDAIVPTQDALIVDTIDPEMFDLSTLEFTRVGFLKWDQPLPGGQSVDPMTGDYPSDPMAGFLPAFNPDTGFEIGWIEYTVDPVEGLGTGTQLANVAYVEFDFAGDIYVSTDNDPLVLWLDDTTDTEAFFVGVSDHEYAFYSVAIDNVGNRESHAQKPDARTTVSASAMSGRLDVTLVHQPTSTLPNGEVDALPVSEESIDEWDSFWIEIWVSTPDTVDVPIVSATVDLTYNTDYFTATSIEYGPGLDLLQIGTIDDGAGVVDDLGARTLAIDVGDDQHALLARVRRRFQRRRQSDRRRRRPPGGGTSNSRRHQDATAASNRQSHRANPPARTRHLLLRQRPRRGGRQFGQHDRQRNRRDRCPKLPAQCSGPGPD